MRQAGRCLPEYRQLRAQHSFLELVRTPELASEVTLQPVRRFGFDAAILFSDILVIPEAMGQAYSFRDGGGVQMAFTLRSAADIDNLAEDAVVERLQYVADALRLVKRTLDGKTALIGFTGSPWTLANFMLEGGSSHQFSKAMTLFQTEPRLYARLAEKLARAASLYLDMQIEAGVDAVQIFDTLGGALSAAQFVDASSRWMTQMVSAVGGRVPVIVFSKGMNSRWETLVQTGAQVLGVDWTVPLARVRTELPARTGVQGNLDPAVLTTTPAQVAAATRDILESMRGHAGHIFNLGHGVPPEAGLENIASLVDTVKNFK